MSNIVNIDKYKRLSDKALITRILSLNQKSHALFEKISADRAEWTKCANELFALMEELRYRRGEAPFTD